MHDFVPDGLNVIERGDEFRSIDGPVQPIPVGGILQHPQRLPKRQVVDGVDGPARVGRISYLREFSDAEVIRQGEAKPALDLADHQEGTSERPELYAEIGSRDDAREPAVGRHHTDESLLSYHRHRQADHAQPWRTADRRGDVELMAQERFDFRDLVRAWSDMRRWSDAHDDLADYHARRCRALSDVFGASFDQPPATAPPMPDWMSTWRREHEWTTCNEAAHRWDNWTEQCLEFASEAENSARSLETPFDGYLEAPVALIAAREQYGHAIEAPIHDARARIFDMIVDLLAAAFPDPAARTITADELRAAGFDPSAPMPDPLDYW